MFIINEKRKVKKVFIFHLKMIKHIQNFSAER